MVNAIYRGRTDGDWDFVAAFDMDFDEEVKEQWLQEIKEWIEGQHDEAKIVSFDGTGEIVDVLEGQNEEA